MLKDLQTNNEGKSLVIFHNKTEKIVTFTALEKMTKEIVVLFQGLMLFLVFIQAFYLCKNRDLQDTRR